MTRIVDRRPQGRSPSSGNRKKFLERYKRYVKESIDKTIEGTKIKDIKNSRKVKIPVDRIDEPTYNRDPSKGVNRRVTSGNSVFTKGSTMPKPSGSAGGGGRGAGNGSDGESDAFEFSLTKDEFLDILFEDMSLPNYVKENMKADFKEKRIRAGYTKEGIMPRLNLKKTCEQGLARRIAHRGSIRRRIEEATTEQEKKELEKKKVPFLEEVDLRYNFYKTVKYPVKTAVMFCLMDVSGSMGEVRKDLAKRFFLLLYLFLEKQYDRIDIRFIRHTETAEEVDEDEFFYGKKSGGTLVSTCFEKMLEIIDEEYDPNIYNIYAAQASDGDNWGDDNDNLIKLLEAQVLPKLQYLAYIEVDDYAERRGHIYNVVGGMYGNLPEPLSGVYKPLTDSYDKFNQAQVLSKEDVFGALKGLFSNE